MGDLNTWVLFGIALLNALTAFMAFRTRNDIHTLEVNTNSIKDALVARTAEASEAKGRDEQRAVGEERAALIAQGRGEVLEKRGPQAGPVPVTDSRTAKAAEATAASTEKLAEATVKIALSTEPKKET